MNLLQHEYSTSKDYEKLFALVHEKRITCFIATDEVKKDVCQSQIQEITNSISIGTRGITYIYAMEFNGLSLKDDFIKQCNECNLEFINPNTLTNL